MFKTVEQQISLDAVNPEVLKKGFQGPVIVQTDDGSKFYKVVMYPVGFGEFRVCDYDKYNPRLQNARDTKIQADNIMDALEIVQKYWGEIIRVKPYGWTESITINEECKIPGTDVILEKGDVVKVMTKMKESDAYDKYLDDVHNTKEYQAYSRLFATLGYFNLYTLKNGNDIEVAIRPDWAAKNDYHPELYYDVRRKAVSIQTSAHGQMDLSQHQIFIAHISEGQRAAELLVKLVNDKKYWAAIPDISTYV